MKGKWKYMLSKKIMTFVSLWLLGSLLVGCQKMGEYSLSEQVINSALQKQLSQYTQSFNASDLVKMNLAFNDINLNIGEQDVNKVVANGTAKASIQTLLGTQHVDIKLNLKALPEMEQKQGAIYLKQVEIADYQLNSSLGSISSGTWLPYLNQALQLYFDNNPIYQVDTSNSLEYLAFKSASHINVAQGKLVFSWL